MSVKRVLIFLVVIFFASGVYFRWIVRFNVGKTGPSTSDINVKIMVSDHFYPFDAISSGLMSLPSCDYYADVHLISTSGETLFIWKDEDGRGTYKSVQTFVDSMKWINKDALEFWLTSRGKVIINRDLSEKWTSKWELVE